MGAPLASSVASTRASRLTPRAPSSLLSLLSLPTDLAAPHEIRGGEIDVIEGYNSLPPPTSSSYEATFASANLPSLPTQLNDTSNTASLHTVSTCSLRKSGLQTGTTETTICDAAANMNSVRRPSDRSKNRSCQPDTFSACLFSRVVVSISARARPVTAGTRAAVATTSSGATPSGRARSRSTRSPGRRTRSLPTSSPKTARPFPLATGPSPRPPTLVSPSAPTRRSTRMPSSSTRPSAATSLATPGAPAAATSPRPRAPSSSKRLRPRLPKPTGGSVRSGSTPPTATRPSLRPQLPSRSSHLHVYSFRGSIWPWLTSDDALDISVVQIHCPFDRSSHARLFCYRRAWTCTSLDLVRLHPARCKADSSSNRLLLYYLPKYTRCGLCSVDSAFPRCFVSRPLSRPPRMQAVGSSWGRKGRLGA